MSTLESAGLQQCEQDPKFNPLYLVNTAVKLKRSLKNPMQLYARKT